MMEFNRSIIDAARKTIEAQGVPAKPLGISDCPGMVVAKSDCAKFHAMIFCCVGKTVRHPNLTEKRGLPAQNAAPFVTRTYLTKSQKQNARPRNQMS